MPKHFILNQLLPVSGLALLALIVPCAASAAPVTVTSTSTANGLLFSYDFTVTNTSLPDLLSVTLTTPSQPNAVQNLTAPTGFSAFFDAGVGLVDFVSDTLSFTVGSSVSGFALQSPFQLSSTAFSTLSLDADQNPVVTTGTVSPAPEPASLGLVGLALLSVFGLQRWGSSQLTRRASESVTRLSR